MNFSLTPPLFPEQISLPDNEVHVWRADLNASSTRTEEFWQTLNDAERERANRFHFPIHRQYFICARGLLRLILGKYTNRHPARIQFDYGTYGKPYLADPMDFPYLCFNLSHSHNLALYAISQGRQVGIDIEYIISDRAIERIAERYFLQSERAVLNALPLCQQVQAFFQTWTYKEAHAKATGRGLAQGLDLLDVSSILRDEASVLYCSPWSLVKLHPGSDYVAALAAERQGWDLKCWNFTDATVAHFLQMPR